MYDLLKKNSAFFIPYILFLLIGTACLILWNKVDISLFINGHHSPPADFFFAYWTNVGLGYLILPVALVLAFKNFRYMLMALACFLITFIINDSLKYVFQTPRPMLVFASLNLSFYHVPNVEIYSWNSFPSGHSAISFALFCLLALRANKPSSKFAYFVFAFLVCYSRIYLAEHFITDVIGGSVIGVSSAIFIYKTFLNWKALNKFANIDKPLINLSGQ